ncbi:antibiotic biosynthesis monooxygenase family protein [Plantactinospora siamensis]|uniref:Antibiotic biosynthesis monooxygenase family protein n=1 Tax=Plantactinospora siamensis TaxID=555372 RepID=A0ABV6NWR1_9ACTN
MIVYASAPEGDPSAVERAYHVISGDLAGTPGLRGNQLLRSVMDPADYAVVSEWVDLAAFRSWEVGAGHRGATAPLRPHQRANPGTFAIYEVVASY